MLFKIEHVKPILTGVKTQTRRLKKPHIKVGGIYDARLRLFDPSSVFAKFKVLRIWRERLRDMKARDVGEEGYHDYSMFLEAFATINRLGGNIVDYEVWVVEFEVVEPEYPPMNDEAFDDLYARLGYGIVPDVGDFYRLAIPFSQIRGGKSNNASG